MLKTFSKELEDWLAKKIFGRVKRELWWRLHLAGFI